MRESSWHIKIIGGREVYSMSRPVQVIETDIRDVAPDGWEGRREKI